MSLFGVSGDDDRVRIRALRAAPPGRAALDPDRRKVFAAALGQFDELLTAAASVGPTTSPLPLYYALNQAGRAIAAARQQHGDEWEPLLHGLKIGDATTGYISDTEIKPSPGTRYPDSFSILTKATFAPQLSEATVLGSVWAAIPQLDAPGLGGGRPRALLVGFDPHSPAPVFGALTRIDAVDSDDGKRALLDYLQRTYPNAADGLDVVALDHDPSDPLGRPCAEVCWKSPDGTHRDVYSAVDTYLGGRGAGWLLPAINPARDVLRPLQLWWCLLYALSHLARYRPAVWADALDPDTSTQAVPIEKALATALDVVPRLVLLALHPGAAAS